MKILCIDHHPLFRDGLALLLQREYERLAFVHAGNCETALTILPGHPDLSLILIDLSLPRHRPDPECISVVQAAAPGVPLLVLSEAEDPGIIFDCIDRGAMGFIPKTASTEVLLTALRRVLGGEPYVPASAIRHLDMDIRPGTPPAPDLILPRLTMRESEVLALLMRGMRNKLIANRLGVSSEGTVKQHVSSVLSKLKARNRTEAVVKAVVMGLNPQLPNQEAISPQIDRVPRYL